MQRINHLRAAAQIQPRSTIRGYVTAIRRTIPYAADFLPHHADDDRPQGRLRLPGCPKALVDSERILTQLRAEGYEVSAPTTTPTWSWSTRAVSSIRPSAGDPRSHRRSDQGKRQGHRHRLPRRGRRRVSGDVHPKVLAVTGPQQYEQVVQRGARVMLPAGSRPVDRPRAAARHQADPAPLRVPEDLRRLQPPLHVLHHPVDARRTGSRPVGDVLDEAEHLVKSGVKELLVISQDTSAYGVDVKYRTVSGTASR